MSPSGIGAEDDHRDGLGVLGSPELTQHLVSSDVRKMEVKQDQVGMVLARKREANASDASGEILFSAPRALNDPVR